MNRSWAASAASHPTTEDGIKPGLASALAPTDPVLPLSVATTPAQAGQLVAPGPQALPVTGDRVAPVLDAASSVLLAPLIVRVRAESWVEVVDGTGKALVARNVAAGEALSLNGALPLRVKIGNAAATEVFFRGDNIDLSTQSKDNVARLELK
jgi:cytoskeleton protein RodZ